MFDDKIPFVINIFTKKVDKNIPHPPFKLV